MMDLERIPLEVEGGAIVRVCATTDDAGQWRLAWMRDGGRRKEAFGDPFPSAKAAAKAAAVVNERANA